MVKHPEQPVYAPHSPTLKKQQQDAMERATFVGTTAEEKDLYDDRAQRINLLQRGIDDKRAEPTTKFPSQAR